MYAWCQRGGETPHTPAVGGCCCFCCFLALFPHLFLVHYFNVDWMDVKVLKNEIVVNNLLLFPNEL